MRGEPRRCVLPPLSAARCVGVCSAHNYLIPTEAAKYNTYENRHRYKELIDAAGDVKLTATRDEADAEVDRIRLAVRLLRRVSERRLGRRCALVRFV